VRTTSIAITVTALCVALATPSVAQKMLATYPTLTTFAALQAAQAALARCQKDGFTVAAAVVDRGGQPLALLRDNLAGAHTSQTAIGKAAKSPVLAHKFINFFLDEKNAYNNMVNFNGYTPPQKNIDAQTLIKQGLIPKTLTAAVVRPDQFTANQELLQLSVAGQRLWDDAWSKYKAG